MWCTQKHIHNTLFAITIARSNRERAPRAAWQSSQLRFKDIPGCVFSYQRANVTRYVAVFLPL